MAQRGATLAEYMLVLSLVLGSTVGVITVVEDQAGSFLAATADDIAEPRSLVDDYNFSGNGTYPTLTQPPGPSTSSTVGVTSTTTPLGPNLILNGSFEWPDIANGAWGAVVAPEWTSSASNGRVEIWGTGHNGVPSPEGAQHAELNLYEATTYSQTVTLEPGATYTWTVQHRGRIATETMEVVVDGNAIETLSTAPGAWVTYTGSFVATASSMEFGFRSVTGSGVGNLIDDVRLQRAPSNVAVGANLIINGTFEAPDVADGAWLGVVRPEWQSTEPGGRVEIQGTGHAGVASPEGAQHGEVNYSTNETYSQTVNVTPGATYRWSFLHHGRNQTSTLDVGVDGATVDTVTTGFDNWRYYEGTTVATGPTMTLSFAAVAPTSNVGNLIDDVQLREVSGTAPTGEQIQVKYNGLCLTVDGGSYSAGAWVVLATCTGAADQRWIRTDAGGGRWQFRAAHSWLCLDAAGPPAGWMGNGRQVIQNTCDGATSQQISIPTNGSHPGYVSLVVFDTGDCIDIENNGGAGASALEWVCHTGANQAFDLI